MVKRTKKPTDKQLIKDLKFQLKRVSQNFEYRDNAVKAANAEIQRLIDERNKRFINERCQLLNSIGQLTEAISKAIVYTVGKE